jgi:phenylpyruvate tautomerase PptA (4-oxalocrotonate tautomerase family)
MPIVHVHVVRGRSTAEKKAILDGVHAALVEAFRIPEHDRNQILHEHDEAHFESSHGRDFTLVEATVFPGRTDAAKSALFASITRRLQADPGIPPPKVLVVLHEPPLPNWGIRGGRSAAEVGVGFKLDV